jgi:hypothetical protein
MGIPPLGLLLDVDGPIASPLTRTKLHALGHQVTHVDVRPARCRRCPIRCSATRRCATTPPAPRT